MSHQTTPSTIATIGIDIGKNTFHLVGLDRRGTIVLQLKVSRSQLEHRLANVPRCLIWPKRRNPTEGARVKFDLGHFAPSEEWITAYFVRQRRIILSNC